MQLIIKCWICCANIANRKEFVFSPMYDARVGIFTFYSKGDLKANTIATSVKTILDSFKLHGVEFCIANSIHSIKNREKPKHNYNISLPRIADVTIDTLCTGILENKDYVGIVFGKLDPVIPFPSFISDLNRISKKKKF